MNVEGGEEGGRRLAGIEQGPRVGGGRRGSGKMRVEAVVVGQTRRVHQTQTRLRRRNLQNHRIQLLQSPEAAAVGQTQGWPQRMMTETNHQQRRQSQIPLQRTEQQGQRRPWEEGRMNVEGGEEGGRRLAGIEQGPRVGAGGRRSGEMRVEAVVVSQTRRAHQTQTRLRRRNLQNHQIQILHSPWRGSPQSYRLN